jgi:hypothetical protein
VLTAKASFLVPSSVLEVDGKLVHKGSELIHCSGGAEGERDPIIKVLSFDIVWRLLANARGRVAESHTAWWIVTARKPTLSMP